MKLAKLVVLMSVVLVVGCNPFNRGKETTQRIYGWGRQSVLNGYEISKETIIETVPETAEKGLEKAGEVLTSEEDAPRNTYPSQEDDGRRVVKREIIRLRPRKPQIRRRIWMPQSYMEHPELVNLLRSAGYRLVGNQYDADLGLRIGFNRDRKSGFGSRIDEYECVAALYDRAMRLVAYGSASSWGSGRIRLPFRFGRSYGNRSFSIPDLGGEDRAVEKAVIAMICDHQGIKMPE